MKAQQLIDEAKSLPVEERARVADSLLRSLNQPDPEIDQAWLDEARSRIQEIDEGEAELIPGDEVFERIRSKFDI